MLVKFFKLIGFVLTTFMYNNYCHSQILDSTSLKNKFQGDKLIKVKSDSLDLHSPIDSIFKNTLKKEAAKLKGKVFSIHGQISTQFDYGTIPYYFSSSSSPIGALKSEGDIKVSLKNIPFIFNYFYSYPRALFGLQNYYSFKFDREAYQQNLQKEIAEKKSDYSTKLTAVEKQKQESTQKLAFCESMQSYQPPNKVSNNLLPVTPNGLATDSVRVNAPDTNNVASMPLSKQDSLKQYQSKYLDSLLNNFDAKENKQKIKQYKDDIELYDKQIKEYKQAINTLETNQVENIQNPYLGKTKNILGNIKQFQIGLCYPNYSSFLINNLTLNGINVEYETKNYFVNFTYGKTVNNPIINQTNNTIINTFRNYGNFFDFNNSNDSRKILAGKIGLGNQSKSYIGFGALYGIGNQGYFQQTNIQEKNIVYELDGKINLKGYTFYASWAKSFITQSGSSETTDILRKSRNNGLQLRFSGTLPYTKTKFSLGYRMVDPFFKSYGAGFIRTDNIRYEAKIDQTFSSKFKMGLNFRYDMDNILKRYGFQSNLYFFSVSSRFKLLKKRLDLQFIYTPIVQNIENLATKLIQKNRSDMKNVIVSYTPKSKKNIYTITTIYSQYTLYDSTSLRNMENLTLNTSAIFKSSFRVSLNSAYFDSNVRDSIRSPKTIVTSIEPGFTFKKNIFTSISLKHSYNFLNEMHQFGAGFNINFPLMKFAFLELHAEKLVIGDFYNSLNLENVDKFPYYCYIKLNLKF
jgi:hypothetical protein